MAELRRFDVEDHDEYGDGNYTLERVSSKYGSCVDAEEHIAAIAELNATIERLRSELEAEQARTICAMCGEELTRMAASAEDVTP